MTIKTDLEQLKADLIAQRDELKVKMGIAKAEIKEEWQSAEDKTEQLFDSLSSMTHDTKEDVIKGAKQLGDDLKKTYASIKSRVL